MTMAPCRMKKAGHCAPGGAYPVIQVMAARYPTAPTMCSMAAVYHAREGR